MRAHGFQSPETELLSRKDEFRDANSQVGFGLDPLIRRLSEEAPFDLSLTIPGSDRRAGKNQEATRFLRERLILPHSLEQPSEATIVSRHEEKFYSVEEIEFTVTPPLRAPATVVIPRNRCERHPAIVALHSMGGMRAFGREKLLAYTNEPACLTDYRQRNYSGRSLQAELALRGYLSITIDAFNFGRRTGPAHQDADFTSSRMAFSMEEARDFAMQAGIQEATAARALGTAGASLAALVATDDLRTVDYLCSRPDVDIARVGCVGLSFGSFRTNYLSALDDRIRAAASVCWISTLDGIVNYNITGSMGFFALPSALYSRMDLTDIIALSAPKPFLAISGWRDPLMQPAGMARAHLRLREYWRAAGAEEAFGSLVYDTGHEFNAAMQEAAWRFLDRHLRL